MVENNVGMCMCVYICKCTVFIAKYLLHSNALSIELSYTFFFFKFNLINDAFL
jgi:hypothetical protein